MSVPGTQLHLVIWMRPFDERASPEDACSFFLKADSFYVNKNTDTGREWYFGLFA